MNKTFIIIAIAILGLTVGLFFAFRMGFYNKINDVASDAPPSFVALHKHFKDNGVDTKLSMVRRETTGVLSKSVFILKNPNNTNNQSFVVESCQSNEIAIAQAEKTVSFGKIGVANGCFALQINQATDEAKKIAEVFARFNSADWKYSN